jgi:hypothetical protein
MARLYRLALNGRIRSDEMTRFIYALKEIRACLEAELLTDVQQRLALLSFEPSSHAIIAGGTVRCQLVKVPVRTLNAQTDRSEKAIGLPNACLIRVRTQ